MNLSFTRRHPRIAPDAVADGQCELERAARVLSGHRGPVAAAHRVDEGNELRLERVALGELVVPEHDARDRPACGAGVGARKLDRAVLEVDRNVAVGLEHAQLAHRLRAHAARGHVGDAAVRELDACVGDVDPAGEHRDAVRAHLDYWRVDERQDDVEVMNHQVEHDVDVGAARLERREPVAFHEPGRRDAAAHCDEGGVEALEVPDPQHQPLRGR